MTKKSKRVYYRHTQTGDLGYLAEDGEHIILDRPLERIERPKDGNWELDKERRPLTKYQLAQIAFAADAQLCAALGQKNVNPGQWANLREQDRIKWIEHGPRKGIRRTLYAFVLEALKPLSEPK